MIFKPHPALVALVTVIVIGAVGVVIVVFVVLSGVDLIQLGHQDTKTVETFSGSDGCVEEALIRLNSDSSYVGESITIGSVNCVITVSGSGTGRTIEVNATLESIYSSDIDVTVTIDPKPMVIDAWTEVVN